MISTIRVLLSFPTRRSSDLCQDIAGPHAGLVSACMNTAGQVGAVLSPIILPHFEDPAVPLCIAGALYLAGASCWLDRKSTRLNSSHANISYAVFCLKKKRL